MTRSLGWIDRFFIDHGDNLDLCSVDDEVGEGSRDYEVEVGNGKEGRE